MESGPSSPPDHARRDVSSARTITVWAIAVVMVAVALLLVPLPNDYRARWISDAMDFCHVPLFGALTFVLGKYLWPQRLGWAVAAVLGMILLAEVVQPVVGRSASVRDGAYGLIGAVVALVWLRTAWPWAGRLAMIAILVSWPLARTVPVVVDAAWAWRSFPVLFGTGSPFEWSGWYLEDVRWQQDGDDVRLDFAAGEKRGTGAILLPVVRDWTGYETLEVSFSFEGPPLLFLISVRDGKKLPPELPRFDLWRRYPSGKHVVRIDMSELEAGGDFPPIETHRIQSFHLVAFDEQPRTVVMQYIRLVEPKSTQAR